MKRVKKILLTTMILMAALTGCKEKEKENIKIVVAGPLTGDNAEYGNGFKNAAELKIKEYNENGGVLGKQVILETYDDKNTGEEGATIAQKISSDSDVVAVIGHFSSGVSMVAAPTYDENKIIQISPSASHPDYASLGKYIFRNNTVINIEAEEGVKLATQVLNGKKIGLLSIRTDWGTSTAEITKELIKKYGATLVGHEEVVEGSDDYLPNVTKLNDAGAEVVIVAGMYNTLAPFARQYKSINPNIEFVGFSNAYSNQLLELGGEAVENVHFPTIFFHESTNESVKEFVKKYEKAYESLPNSLTAQAYDSVGIVLEAIKKANSLDAEKVRNEVQNIDYNGVTGETKFDENGDAIKSFVYVKVENGKFVRLVKKNRFYNKGDKNVKSTIVKWTSFRNDLCLISSRIFFSFWNIEIGKLFSWFSICFWSTYLLNVYKYEFWFITWNCLKYSFYWYFRSIN